LTGTPASRMSQIVSFSSSQNRTTATPPGRRHKMLANQHSRCDDSLRTHLFEDAPEPQKNRKTRRRTVSAICVADDRQKVPQRAAS
jgi:hypothetical protein